MLELKVTPTHAKPFACVIDRDTAGQAIVTNVEIRLEDWPAEPIRCRDCLGGKMVSCKLFEATLPITVYFSELSSVDEVLIEWKEDGHSSRFVGQAQRACLIVFLLTTFYSGCIFFDDCRDVVSYFAMDVSNDSFMHMIQSIVAMRNQVRVMQKKNSADFYRESKRFCKGFSKRMLYTLINAKRISERDAVLNAINTIIGLNELTPDRLYDYHATLAQQC